MNHITGNALIPGKIYQLDGYGKARYDGMLIPESGWLWKFTCVDGRGDIKHNQVFTIQYSGLGIKAKMI